MINNQANRYRRHKRVRSKVKGTDKLPRLCVFRSSKHIYAQLIDDQKGKTLVSASDLDIKNAKPKKELSGKALNAYQVGQVLAEKAIKNKLEKIVFDRGGYKYHGRVKALAEGAREAGLKF